MKICLLFSLVAAGLLSQGCAPSRSYSHYDMGNYMISQDKVDAAIDEYKKSLAEDPQDPTVHEALAKVFSTKGYKDLAIQAWENALANSWEDPSMYPPGPDGQKRSTAWIDDGIKARARAVADIQVALHDRAKDFFDKKEYSKAQADWIQITQINLNHKSAWKGLGRAYEKIKKPDLAYNAWKEAVRIDGNDAFAQRRFGYAAFRMNNLDEAEKAFSKYIVLKPDNPVGYNNLGTVMSEQRRFGLAMDQFNRALQIKPNFVESLNGIATAHYYKKEYKEARAVWGKVLDLEPENANATENIRTLVQMGY